MMDLLTRYFDLTSRPRKSRGPRRPSRSRPRLEPLEERVVPVGQMFEIDGNATTQTTHDWDLVFHNTSGALDSVFLHDTANVFFGGQTADNTDLSSWRYDPRENVTDTLNILDAFAATYVEDGDLILYFGGDRRATVGSAAFGFWFLQDPAVGLNGNGRFTGNHVVGDLLVVVEVTQGGAVGTLAVYEWVGFG